MYTMHSGSVRVVYRYVYIYKIHVVLGTCDLSCNFFPTVNPCSYYFPNAAWEAKICVNQNSQIALTFINTVTL